MLGGSETAGSKIDPMAANKKTKKPIIFYVH